MVRAQLPLRHCVSARVLLSGVVMTACVGNPEPPSESPAVDESPAAATAQPSTSAVSSTPAVSQSYPQIRLDVSNPAADEGEFWNIEIHADRSLTREYTWSDGAQDTVQTCTAVLPAEDVDPWLSRLARGATLESPPPPVPRPDGDLRDYDYTLGYAADADTVRYADPEPWRAELDAWFQRLVSVAGVCSEAQP